MNRPSWDGLRPQQMRFNPRMEMSNILWGPVYVVVKLDGDADGVSPFVLI